MKRIFIDSSIDITVGIVNEDYSWLSYEHYPKAHGSAVIHKFIDDHLKKNNLTFKDISGIIQMSGPGSYTGMRVSEGVSQIFSWQNYELHSLYHYEVPGILGIESGKWISNAFKGELFIHNLKDQSSTLKAKSDFHSDGDLYSSFLMDGYNLVGFSSTMIKENGVKIFKHIIDNNIKRDLFYYRSLEQEFGRS